jgi:hypothetical protein
MSDWMKRTCPTGATGCMASWCVSFIIHFPKLIIPQYLQGRLTQIRYSQPGRQGLYNVLSDMGARAINEVERKLEAQRTADATERERVRAAAELKAQQEALTAIRQREEEELALLEIELREVEAEVRETLQRPMGVEEHELDEPLDIQMEVAEDEEGAGDDDNDDEDDSNNNNDSNDSNDEDDNKNNEDDEDENDNNNSNDDDDDDDDTNSRKYPLEQKAVSSFPFIHVFYPHITQRC